jgi:conjugal transfer mating pair stabilization protein TraG
MDPTIYTMGDPMIVREALFALAAIFNSTDWFNPANAFGLGGNLLAAALIGLLGILIAGINSQTMRVDYLLTAFVLFGIAFGVKVDVNIEDIQTGSAARVDDVPAGVAYVASLASSASYELAQDISTALQRPGSETSVMTADGFLNPLKVLLALRELRLEALDPTLHATLMTYYRFCVGKTLEQPGSPFSMREFTNTVDPIAYLTDHGNVQNWMTVEYTEAAPEGFARPCHDVADNINARVDALTAGLDDRLVTWASRKLGSRTYDGGYTLGDLQDSLDILNRSGLSAQNVMANMMIANLHNAGEAWRVAEYGTDKSQYVATLTEAMESQRVEVATQGSMFLQMMFPLMGFFQFLFFALPPIIVLVMLAAPAAAVRILGFYLLFGVWAYGWVPIAAVINHYIEIAVQNDIEFAREAMVASGYTSILGFDSLYNVVATKLTIGANALASVPVILGAILTATPFAISNIAGRMAGGGKVNTSIAAPSLLSNGPVMQRAGLASAPVGSVVSAGGSFVAASSHQKDAYGTLNWGSTMQRGIQAHAEAATSARAAQSAAATSAARTVDSVMASSDIESGQKKRLEAAMQSSLATAYGQSVDQTTREALTADQTKQVIAEFAFRAFGTGAGVRGSNSATFTTDQQKALGQMLASRDETRAAVAQSLVDTGELETEVASNLKRDVETAKTAGESAERSEQYARTAGKMLEKKQSLGISGSIDTTALSTMMFAKDRNADMATRALVSAAGGAKLLNAVDAAAQAEFARTAPMGLDGKQDREMDRMDRQSAWLRALDRMAGESPEAAKAYMDVLGQVGGLSVPVDEGMLAESGAATAGAEAAVEGGSRLRERVDAQIASTSGAIASERGQVQSIGASIEASAREREDVGAMAAAWRGHVADLFEKDPYGVRAAAVTVDDAIAEAKREQSGSATGRVLDWLRPGSGSDAESRARLDALPEGKDEEAVRAGASAVAALGGQMRAQGDVTADPEKVYADFVNLGYSPKAAAELAYASAGPRTAGGADLIAAGVGVSAITGGAVAAGQAKAASTAAAAARGSAEALAAGNAARALGLVGKFAGPLAGAATVVGGAAVAAWADKKDAAAVDAGMQTAIMGTAREKLGEERFKAFEGELKALGGVRNAEQLATTLLAFETGQMPDGGQIKPYPTISGDAQAKVDGYTAIIRGRN